MLYKRSNEFFELSEAICNICEEDLVLKKTKRQKDKLIYYSIVKCSNNKCVTNTNNSKKDKLRAFYLLKYLKIKYLN